MNPYYIGQSLAQIAVALSQDMPALYLGETAPPVATNPATLIPASEIYVTTPWQIPVRAAALAVGQKYRLIVNVSNTASIQTTTVNLKFGPLGTIADANVLSFALVAGTGNAGVGEITCEFTVKSINASTGTVFGTVRVLKTGTNGFTGAAVQFTSGQLASANTTVPNFIGVSLTSTIANIVTVTGTSTEIVGTG